MKLIPVSAGHFHCDGGALFGVIPKVLWSKVYPADKNNITKLTLRCLLIDLGKQKILIETGVGSHYPEKYMRNNGLTPGNYLENSLLENGYSPDDITDVLFTHLHWDHCNGAVKLDDNVYALTFRNAKLWCSKKQWEHAKISNKREKAAYHSEILNFMYHSGKMNFIEAEGEIFPNIETRFFDGHTPGQIIPFIKYKNKCFVYTSDLIPTSANISLLWIAAYDLFPVTVMKEKEKFLKEAVKNGYILFFEHDYYAECATVQQTKKGIELHEKFNFVDLT